jgi:ribosomal protein S18 acetylase RimI-like enzyme
MPLDPVHSHLSWFGRGRERIRLDGVDVFLGSRDATIAFPAESADLRAAVGLAVDRGVREVGCWALTPDEQLSARLHALGFQDGWAPHWMGIDPRAAVEAPRGRVEESPECADGLPYGWPGHGAVASEDVHHFIVREDARIVGHAVLDVAGEHGGIYDMGVAPDARGRGHARSLTLAALARAREEGCTGVTLNATGEGEPVYRRVGFESLGWGMTWWLFPRD